MRILLIPDKFKGSLTATEVIKALRDGIGSVLPNASFEWVIASDGGDGFLDSIRQASSTVKSVLVPTTDPLGREIEAEFLLDSESQTAYVEMAKASGMELLSPQERNPLKTSTAGTGILIRAAIDQGARRVYVGLGGSATNDGGVGIACQFGYRFLDGDGKECRPVGGDLARIESIVKPASHDDVQIYAINDVANPLCGEEGAAHVYAPQKGADPEMVSVLDDGLNHLQSLVVNKLGIDHAALPGAGAAGGTGYGLSVFLGAEFVSGIEFVLRLAGAEKQLAAGTTDLIITGEGRIDDQTAYGKLVDGVSRIGAKYGVPVVAICGLNDLKNRTKDDLGLAKLVQIHSPERELQFTIDHAADLVRQAAKELVD